MVVEDYFGFPEEEDVGGVALAGITPCTPEDGVARDGDVVLDNAGGGVSYKDGSAEASSSSSAVSSKTTTRSIRAAATSESTTTYETTATSESTTTTR